MSTSSDTPEIKIVTSHKIFCDGDDGVLGHPRVWLTIPTDKGWVECGYCDRRYQIASKASGKVTG